MRIGRLDLHKAVFVIIVPRHLDDLVAQQRCSSLHLGPAQVEVAVFEAQLLIDVAVFHNFKGRRFGGRQNAQLACQNFHGRRSAGRSLTTCRARTVPHTASTYSAAHGKRLVGQLARSCRLVKNAAAPWPVRSRRSIKISPPRSRCLLHPPADGRLCVRYPCVRNCPQYLVRLSPAMVSIIPALLPFLSSNWAPARSAAAGARVTAVLATSAACSQRANRASFSPSSAASKDSPFCMSLSGDAARYPLHFGPQ